VEVARGYPRVDDSVFQPWQVSRGDHVTGAGDGDDEVGLGHRSTTSRSAQPPRVKSTRSADSPRPTKAMATICGGNRPWATTPGVNDSRAASAAGSSIGPW